MISILILTRNEVPALPAALASVAWSDDIHVFDSYSTDATLEIAKAAGAHTHQRAFDDYATHRNAALTTIVFKHPWVFLLDADERPTPELSREMQQLALAAPPEISGFRLRRRDFLFDTWLKHAQISPFYIRLVRPEHARYTPAINEVIEVEGPIPALSYPLDHYPFSNPSTPSRACRTPPSASPSLQTTSTLAVSTKKPSSIASPAAQSSKVST